MKKSSPILPIPIYDDLFDQQRFNFHTYKSEQTPIAFIPNELPSFQYKRDKSLVLPDKFYLRNVCSDKSANFYKVVPEPANIFSNFASKDYYGAFPKVTTAFIDDGIVPPYSTPNAPVVELTPCGIKNPEQSVYINYPTSGGYANYVLDNILSGFRYCFKITVDKFVRGAGSAFEIRIYCGDETETLLQTITKAGIYTIDFLSDHTKISVVFYKFQEDDQYLIVQNQAWLKNPLDYILFLTDRELDETKLKCVPLTDGTDIVAHCDNNQNYEVPPGEYYYIIKDGDNVYFSEVFRVISFAESEKQYRLRWWSECDINNSVIYRSSILDCLFYNSLYLDAALFRPEHQTKEDGIENGEGELNVTFSSWKKSINLEIAKSPEFLTDALSAIFLHEIILIKKPLNQYQDKYQDDFRVLRVLPEVSSVLEDNFQSVNLKLLLEDLFTKTGCCKESDVFLCSPCTYTATADECDGTGYQLKLTEPPEEGDGLIDCSTGQLVDVDVTDLICFDGKYYSLILVDGVWNVNYIAPYAQVTESTGSAFTLGGYVIPNTFAIVEYQIDGGAWVQTALSIGAGDDGAYSIVFDASSLSYTTLKARIRCKTLNCDYGASDAVTLV